MCRVHRALAARLSQGDPERGNVLLSIAILIALTMIALIFIANAAASTDKARSSRDFVVAGQLSRLAWQDGMFALNNDTSVPRYTGVANAMAFFGTWQGGVVGRCTDPNGPGTTAAKDDDVSFGSAALTTTARRCWTLQLNSGSVELVGVGWFNGTRRQSATALGAVNISADGTSANATNTDGSALVGYSASPSTAWGSYSLFAASTSGTDAGSGPAPTPALSVARLRNAAPAAGPVTLASNGRVSVAATGGSAATDVASATLFNGYRNLVCDTAATTSGGIGTCNVAARVGGLMSLDQATIERHVTAMCGLPPAGGFPVWKASEAARQDGGGAGQLVATPGTAINGGVQGAGGTASGIGTVYCFSKMVFDAPYTLSGSGLANAYVVPSAATSTTQDCPYSSSPQTGHTPNPNSDAVVFCDGSTLSAASGADLDVVVTGASSVWLDSGAVNLNNFYLLAPGSTCTAAPTSTLTLNGSLGCSTVKLSEVYATPRPATAEKLTYQSYLDNLYQRSGWYPFGYQEAVQ